MGGIKKEPELVKSSKTATTVEPAVPVEAGYVKAKTPVQAVGSVVKYNVPSAVLSQALVLIALHFFPGISDIQAPLALVGAFVLNILFVFLVKKGLLEPSDGEPR